ncbi:hypothetical protein MHM95_05565 [Pseudoalteromonas sp. CnMc7-15]|uniref:hypothetical protein n=1 Tax=unclassified Pseudoalteromonas TaxID=194690 RepID=UPI001EF4BB05|nr:hypothetical protein [Pseudoalteromonas sp. CnMc7-15]MCG7565752.1 hypothetical protein [Pseudoalteromonas sp. CnMc7-15]
MDNYPQEYSMASYIQWHDRNVEPGKSLNDELDLLLSELKDNNKDRLGKLADLLSRIHSFHLLASKMKREDVSDCETQIQLQDRLLQNYDSLFKTKESIIDKLWRKNKGVKLEDCITSQNIKQSLGDLVRTSIVTSTFSYAENLASSIGLWKDLVAELRIDESDYADIASIETQQEAKMDNGYFAYHLDVKYTDGLRVEVQIYSKLSEVWRHLSHKLYEKIRLGEDVNWGHGAAASRIVSLGHLLHLAECEVQYLKNTIEK